MRLAKASRVYFIVRLLLGMCEGSIAAGFMIISSMFYTRNEQTLRVGYWCTLSFYLCPQAFDDGVHRLDDRDLRTLAMLQLSHVRVPADVISGFLSFGALHIKTKRF